MKEKPEMTEAEEEELRKNPINVFTCHSCKDVHGLPFKEFKEHLTTIHKLTPDQFKGSKQMVMHLDGAQYFSSVYDWTLETGLKFTQSITMARIKGDPMRYGG